MDGTDDVAPATATETSDVPGLTTQVGQLLDDKAQWLPGSLPEVVVAIFDAPVSDAISTMNRYGIDALPVVGGVQDKYRIGELRGAVTVRDLMHQLATGSINADSTLAETTLTDLPRIGHRTTVEAAKTVLETAPAAMVTRDGNIAGIISAHDILMHLIEK